MSNTSRKGVPVRLVRKRGSLAPSQENAKKSTVIPTFVVNESIPDPPLSLPQVKETVTVGPRDELIAELRALENEASTYNTLAKQIHEKEMACLKKLSGIRSKIRQNSSLRQDATVWDQYQYVTSQFPRPAHFMLQLALGKTAPFSLRPLKLRLSYKKEYELFKLRATILLGLIAIAGLFIHHQLWDYLFQFSLLYYYCTLVLREHILVVNGSTIRTYWLLHHYVSIGISGLLLMWPFSVRYELFRAPYMLFGAYLSVIQILQYRYQQARLYALVALDQAKPMDTVASDGFFAAVTSGNAKGATTSTSGSQSFSSEGPKSHLRQRHPIEFWILLPFLFLSHAWELYLSSLALRMYLNIPYAFTGENLWLDTKTLTSLMDESEWHVLSAGMGFGFLAVGNVVTTLYACFGSATVGFSRSGDTTHEELHEKKHT